MEELVKLISDAIPKAGLIQVEVSARHVHLSQQDMEKLFGQGAQLLPKRELSQKGQFLAEQRVNLVGPKGRKESVAILGPLRKDTQVELSQNDCIEMGIKAPIRESGDVQGSAAIVIEGPMATIELAQGAMIAHKHIHLPPEVANHIGCHDKESVSVQIYSDRPTIYQNVIIRIDESFRSRMHVDFDEANAAGIKGFILGKIIKEQKL